MTSRSKRSTTDRGAAGENIAVLHLEGCGYRIIARNYRCARGEIDIIADDHGTLCFVEVRSLATDTSVHPLETITPAKIRRIVAAARTYLDELSPPWPPMRFDAVGLVMSDPPRLTLVRDAFEA